MSDIADDEPCPTCGYTNDDVRAINCSNAWHLTGEDRIPNPVPYRRYSHEEVMARFGYTQADLDAAPDL